MTRIPVRLAQRERGYDAYCGTIRRVFLAGAALVFALAVAQELAAVEAAAPAPTASIAAVR